MFCIFTAISIFLITLDERRISNPPYWMFLTRTGETNTEVKKILSYRVVKKEASLLSEAFNKVKSNMAMSIAEEVVKEKGGNVICKYNEILADMVSNNTSKSDYYLEIIETKESSTINMTYTAETEDGRKVSGDVSMRLMINFADIEKIEIIPDKVFALRYEKGIRLKHLSNMMKKVK